MGVAELSLEVASLTLNLALAAQFIFKLSCCLKCKCRDSGEWKNPGMNAALSESMLLTWAQPCQEPSRFRAVGVAKSFPRMRLKGSKPSSEDQTQLTLCAENVHHGFLCLDVYILLKTNPHRDCHYSD